MNREGEAGRGPVPREAALGGPRILQPPAHARPWLLGFGGRGGSAPRHPRFRDLLFKCVSARYLREVSLL